MGFQRFLVLGAAGVFGLALHLAAPPPAASLRVLRTADRASDPVEPLLAVLSLLAQALWLWLAVAVLAVVAGQLPGLAGQAGRCLSRLLVPAVLRRTVELTLGLSVTIGSLGAVPAAAASLPAPPSSAADRSSAGEVAAGVPDLEWPSSGGAPPSPATAAPTAPSSAAAEAPAVPRTPATAPPGQAGAPPSRAGAPPSRPSPSLRPTAPASPAPQRSTGRRSPSAPSSPEHRGAVVVQPGDTLWDLAEAELERTTGAAPSAARVAQAWPSWWSANRTVIGGDPHLIVPGTSLTPPADGSARASS